MIEQLGLFAAPAADSDEQARERAIAVSDSFIVQAPAGSGKTELLVQRFLALLAIVDEPENIVALTFTRKAAGEMRARVTNALHEAATSKLPPEEGHKRKRWELAQSALAQDKKQGWNLLQSSTRLRIVTIDSLCHSIVRQTPWTSELGVVRSVAENADDLYNAAAHRTIQLLGNGGTVADDLRHALVHLDNGVPELEAELVKMLQRRDQWLRHMDKGVPTQLRSAMETTLRRLVCEKLEQIKQAVPSEVQRDLVRLSAFAAANLHLRKPDHPIVACLRADEFPDCSPDAIPVWLGIAALLLTSKPGWRVEGGINSSIGFPTTNLKEKLALINLLDRLRQVSGLEKVLASVRDLPTARFTDTQWETLETFARLLPEAVNQLRAVFIERQSCDYIEVTSAALKALEENAQPSLAVALGHNIEHLLVDEFQDTSVTQVRLFESLTRSWKTEGRTLFLVGDPMQSIYRFRQAEVGSFLRTVNDEKFGALAVQKLRLTKNFRSRQTIVDWVNQVFPTVFPPVEDVTSGAIRFVASVAAARDRERESSVVVHAQFGTTTEAHQQEAAEVLRIIRDLRRRHEKAAILVRSRKHLFNILADLREAASDNSDLRFQAVEIDELAEQVVIGDLRALTHALLHLGNRVAWLAVLRAPWCGLSLADLHALVAGERFSTIWQLMHRRASNLSDDGQARLARIVPILEEALAKRGRLTLRHWVESTWVSLNGPACLRSNRELEDASSYFDLLDRLDSGGDIDSLSALEKSIRLLFSQPDPEANDSIQIMTIHKAKGLEFDAVLLPALGRHTYGDDRSLLLWDERTTVHGTELLMAPMKPKGGEEDLIYEFLNNIEAERIKNESRRLLYVAVTRAKHELHLFGDLDCTAQEFLEEAKPPDSRSLLSLLWPAVRQEFIAQAEVERDRPVKIHAAAESSIERSLSRLPLNWTAPGVPGGLDWWPVNEPEFVDPEDEVTYDWAGERARRIGIVVHGVLQRIAEEGLSHWDEARLRMMQPSLRAALANQGVGPADMPDMLSRTERAILTSITDSRGRWILQDRPHARSEFALTGTVDGQLNNFAIDRTFIADGIRWIVDYKTGSREGGDPEAFLDNEVVRYKEKMDRYAQLFRALDPHTPIKIGLYYPLMNGWREWEA